MCARGLWTPSKLISGSNRISQGVLRCQLPTGPFCGLRFVPDLVCANTSWGPQPVVTIAVELQPAVFDAVGLMLMFSVMISRSGRSG